MMNKCHIHLREPVLKLLYYFVQIVEEILSHVDKEAMRLGIFKT